MPSRSRRHVVVPALVGLGLVSWSHTFLIGQKPRAERTALRGFKEDFFEWKSTLTSDEKAMLLRQSHGTFDKKYRKTEEFNQELPEEKMAALGKLVDKFMDSEVEDYKKQVSPPNFERVFTKATMKEYDYGMSNHIVELDRDAMRMEEYADWRIEQYKKGQLDGELGNGSPLVERHRIRNENEEERKTNLAVLESLKELKDMASGKTKEALELAMKKEVTPVGDEYSVIVPTWLAENWRDAMEMMASLEETHKDDPAKLKELDAERAEILDWCTDSHFKERKILKDFNDEVMYWFNTEEYVEGQTRSDLARAMHKAVTEYNKKEGLEPPPPLDEEYLANLDLTPCNKPGDPLYRTDWQLCHKLYKSEAIASNGLKFLLGIYPTKEKARQEFVDFMKEYDAKGAEMKEECVQFAKQQKAKLAADTQMQERVRKMYEDAGQTMPGTD